MGAIGGEELMNWEKMQGVGNGKEEKILVLVRLRPLSENEISRNEVSDWECINPTTILYRNSLQERSGLPTVYSFDRVFRGDSATREVYEEGTKDIALSVVGGVNSTIFAYGQTSSGKTYTMNGITEYTVADIYDYIQKHEERAFVLKFSAVEIYNEVVRDLLSAENAQLRLLDDPEKGTIIEKLTEETLRDWNHLKDLLSICEAQRQIGETSLNETSSRSHQILRLTIESSAREFLGKDNSTTLSASVNFVDLAGSERASQALSVGQRLKEGCHINRSLLTLGTVIRKLSKGRHGHINYRDSKLTRILQPALGGNARTAIICTLSPARSHVEQSRNTLLFASCAKEVSTNAQVNVVMSDKALVKHLQKEVARLETELRAPGPTCDHAVLLRRKDLQIQKLEKEVRELTKQRDLAHSRIEDLLRTVGNDNASNKLNRSQFHSRDIGSDGMLDPPLSENSVHHSSSDSISDMSQGTERPSARTVEDSDDICKEVQCIEMAEPDQDVTLDSPGWSTNQNEGRMSTLMHTSSAQAELSPTLTDQASGILYRHSYGTLEQKFQEVQRTLDTLVKPYTDELSPGASSSINLTAPDSLKLTRSWSCRDNLKTNSSDFEMAEQSETTPPTGLEKSFPGRPEGFQRKHWRLPPSIYGATSVRLSRNNSQSSNCSSVMDEIKTHNSIQGDEDIPTLGSFVAGLKEMAAKHQFEDLDDQVTEQRGEKNAGNLGLDTKHDSLDASSDWSLKFERLRRSIMELWQACNVPLVHRTYFFLLFKGDFTDSIYIEVEHRRLSFLKETFSNGNPSVQNGRTLSLASSKKALRREREMLSRLVYKRYSENERNKILQEWGISLNSKRRRLQLVHRLWSDATDMEHITKSAAIVAKLIGFLEQGDALKEMFGLSFTPTRSSRKSFSWKNSMASIM